MGKVAPAAHRTGLPGVVPPHVAIVVVIPPLPARFHGHLAEGLRRPLQEDLFRELPASGVAREAFPVVLLPVGVPHLDLVVPGGVGGT